MYFSDYDIAFIKRVREKFLKLKDIPVLLVMKADLHPEMKESKDKDKLNDYERLFIINHIIWPSARLFLTSNKCNEKGAEEKFLEFLKSQSKIF